MSSSAPWRMKSEKRPGTQGAAGGLPTGSQEPCPAEPKKLAEALKQDDGAAEGSGNGKTVFQVCFPGAPKERKNHAAAQGDERLEFRISPNPGEPLRPLARIASGGELSRLMLAMKALEAEGSGVECMVFDEIDTGISGRMAQVVAEKMASIGQHRQVICVTHLPQIAAAADYQFHVSKTRTGGRTRTSVGNWTGTESPGGGPDDQRRRRAARGTRRNMPAPCWMLRGKKRSRVQNVS